MCGRWRELLIAAGPHHHHHHYHFVDSDAGADLGEGYLDAGALGGGADFRLTVRGCSDCCDGGHWSDDHRHHHQIH